MTTLARLLFPLPAVRRSAGTLFAWWETRRPAYNLLVGIAGLITLATTQAISLLPPHLNINMHVPWQVVVVYGAAANVCYSFGFVFETLLQKLWGDDVAPVGPTLFRHGLVFSIGLSLLPIAVAWVGYLITTVQYLVR